MTREQFAQALESGCALYHEGYTIEPEVVFRVRVDKPGMPWTRWDTIEEALDDLDERLGTSVMCPACLGDGPGSSCGPCDGTGRVPAPVGS